MKNVLIALSLILTIGMLCSCEKDSTTPECNASHLNDILSGHAWEVEGSGEIIVFNEDGSLEDNDNFFNIGPLTTNTWSADGRILSIAVISDTQNISMSISAIKVDCDRVVFPIFSGDGFVLLRQ